jgi:hypothetical protein
LHYAPRRLRDLPEQRSTAVEPIRTAREKRPEPPGRAISPPAPIDNQLENAVYESLRRPLDPQVLSETRALAREFERRGNYSISGRVAAAVGISAIIALFFVIMLPASRQPDNAQSFSAAVQSFTTALSQQHPADDAKPALAEFQSLLTSGNTAAAAEQQPAPSSEQQGDKTLQQFLQWRKTVPNDAAQ